VRASTISAETERVTRRPERVTELRKTVVAHHQSIPNPHKGVEICAPVVAGGGASPSGKGPIRLTGGATADPLERAAIMWINGSVPSIAEGRPHKVRAKGW
jgi:hypothetical protein